MKLIKSIIAMAAALAAMVGYAGDSAPFRLDTVTPSTSPTVTSLSVTWDASWIGGNANANIVIKDNGAEVKRATGSGTFTHTLSGGGRHELTYTTYIGGVAQSEVYSVTVYKSVVVTFAANGGSVNEPIRNVLPGCEIGDLPIPTRTGYSFMGWWTSANGGTQISASTTVSGNVTYYAHWTVNQYTVTFNANGGTGGTTKTQNYGTSLTAPTVTCTGYTFTGWSPSVPSTMPAGNTTYTAQWKVNQYTVTFNANGGTGGTAKTQNFGTSLSAPTVMRTGYTLTGWSPSVPSTMPAGNMTYTAQWQINQYTVTFDSAGGTSVSPITQDYATSITPPTNPTRVGYTFKGWSPAVPSTMPANNTTCTAQWQANTYPVALDRQSGSGGTASVTATYGSAMPSITVPTRTGYTFGGYWTGTDGTGTQYYTSAGTSARSWDKMNAMTLYAKWTIRQYTVTFNANGGTGGYSRKQDYGTAIIPPVVTKEWHDYTWSPAVAATVPANNVTYTAQWWRWGDSISASAMGGKTMRQLYPADYARMTTVVLQEGITELPVGFFDGCTNMVSVTWPSTLVEFGIDAVPPKILETLAFDEQGFKIYNGWILDFRPRDAAEVVIPEGIVGIGRGAFAAMYDLETVTMPESLRCIARGAFEDCSWIQELQLMSGLRHVGPAAFRACSSLLRATFADGVTEIGTNAFENCWQMQSVRLPSTVTDIGDSAFTGCGNIRGVTVPTHLKTMQELFPASYAQIETAEVAEGETAVMDSMFAGCVALRGGATQTDMSMIPSTVTNIGARAFQNCTSLTAFVLPDSVETIGEYAFSGCSSLWNVTLSRSLAALPDYAFYGCSSLETMIVPESVEYLGERFFSGRTDPTGGTVANAIYCLCTNAPACHASAYAAISGNMTTYVLQGSRSWDGRQGSRVLPQLWNGYPITYWTPNVFDVAFDANGGRFDLASGSAYTWTEQQMTDTGYALPSTEPVRPGWAFEGWWTEPSGGAQVRYTTLVTATRAHTLYAHWRRLGTGMTVTFNSNGGTVVVPGSQDYVPGQTFGQFPVTTRRGYTFQGWWTESVDGVLMTEATQVPAADMELFAHWAPITYIVRFNANGGQGTMPAQGISYDEEQPLNTHEFTRTGFAFTGWATTPSGQVRYAENALVVNLEEVQDGIVDLYAVWSGAGYAVRFDANGGTGFMDNQTIAVGETQKLWPCAFAYDGYKFTGWAVSPTAAANGTVKYRDGVAVKNLATENGVDVPLYAVWISSDRTARISFKANGGSVAPEYWDCLLGTAVEALPTPTRPGFSFVGWFTAANGGTRVESIASVAGSQTLYAHWTENGGVEPGDGSCTVTFDPNGGSVTETSREMDSGSAVGELPMPARTGYAFLGWFTAAEGGVQISAETVVTGSVTYYAQWERVELPVITPGDGATFHTDTCTVTITCATPGAAIYYSSNGRTPAVNARYLYRGPFTISETTTVTAFAVKGDGQSDYVDATITYTIPEVLTLWGVLDEKKLDDVTTGGSAEWSPVEDASAKVGGSCAVSGEVADDDDAGQTTMLRTKVRGRGTLSFWWRVDCEPDPRGRFTYDYGSVAVDGVVLDRKDGTTEWMNFSTAITTDGEHEIVWTYASDGYPAAYGEYAGRMWVDGVSWSGVAFDPLPAVDGDAEVAGALAGAADARLAEYIKTASEYNAFRAWLDAKGIDHQAAKDSPRAWFSYALDAEGLIDRTFKKGDVVIDSVAAQNGGAIALSVAVAGVRIGANAKAENLARVFSVEGAAALGAGAFSSESVTATFGATTDGKLSVVATPKSATGTLFVRVCMVAL